MITCTMSKAVVFDVIRSDLGLPVKKELCFRTSQDCKLQKDLTLRPTSRRA